MRVALPIALLVLACSDNPPPATTPPDAGEILDASGPPDTGVADSGTTPRDSGTTGIVDECNPVTQAGCVAPRSKCVVENATPGGGAQCVLPAMSDKAFGEACQGGDCAPGLTCVNSAMGPICRQLCDRTDGSGCASIGADWDCREMLRDTNWGACTQLPAACDPFAATPCANGEGCYPLRRRDGRFELRCGPAGNRTHGQSCNDTNTRCAPGHLCVRVGSSGIVECRKYCQMDMDCAGVAMGSMCAGTIAELSINYCHP